MSGYLNDAAGMLRTGAEQMPIQQAMSAKDELTSIIQFCHQVGGGVGNELAQETFMVHTRAEELVSLLAGLRDRYLAAASMVESGRS